MKTILFILILSVSAVAQTPYAKSLSELILSNDEIECFAFYFDIRPEIIRENLDKYRLQYLNEIKAAGYNPVGVSYIHMYVPFDYTGKIIPKKSKVIGIHDEKVVFDHDLD